MRKIGIKIPDLKLVGNKLIKSRKQYDACTEAKIRQGSNKRKYGKKAAARLKQETLL